MQRTLQSLEFAIPSQTHESYFSKLSGMGGVVEEFLEGAQKASPSAQLRNSPDGRVLLISTHDQRNLTTTRFLADDAKKSEMCAQMCAQNGVPARRAVTLPQSARAAGS